MGELEEYIETLKEETKSFSELEVIRYVYIKLGKVMTFDLKFAFGSEKNKNKIYKYSLCNRKSLNKYLESKTIICKSLAYLLEYVLKELGINIITVFDDDYAVNYTHVYNIIRLQDGNCIKIDLQSDLEFIQAHLRTRYFGQAIYSTCKGINRDELEQIDKKIKYISDSEYYADDYDYLIKTVIDYFPNLNDKLEFLLSNLDPYDYYKNMGYAEFRWHFFNRVNLFLTSKEKRKIHVLDMYYLHGQERFYTLCFMVDINNNEREIYLYSLKTKQFEKLSPNEFLDECENNLHSIRNIPRIRRQS